MTGFTITDASDDLGTALFGYGTISVSTLARIANSGQLPDGWLSIIPDDGPWTERWEIEGGKLVNGGGHWLPKPA